MFESDSPFESFTDEQVKVACALRNEVYQRFEQLMAEHGLKGLLVSALQVYTAAVEALATVAFTQNEVEGVLVDLHQILNICYQRVVQAGESMQAIPWGPPPF